jgi:cytochrome b subunit of formate dehydrogenase
MVKNVGKIDRIIRIVAGAILVLIGIFAEISVPVMWIALILGALLIVTGILAFCPLYKLFKFSTNK